ncbi:quinoprotein dehydrogenase-associated SoxYZ-like carrier [Hyphomicrobium sp.]|uniref:quinoprotein dehydrogenase-associated SoxYZ-like carrier n=1 Tax=Hyphomicrobium sp. TaxID=82 RepID=UPI0025BE57A9|nr:quinoprotein dehydrogenase-associated SoxYZ-like carrier [Hyphomicrobium sp.]MCC7251693.1 quinoprotein dehydrogenase-associated SoxYZ-like carrier [Hyphomicrobium sp.]
MVRRPASSLFPVLLLAAAVCTGFPVAGLTSDTWPSIHAEAFGGRSIQDGRGIVKLTAPYRPEDVRSVPMDADIKLPQGRTIKAVSFVVDMNPSPVAAVFRMGEARSAVHLATRIRLDQQSDVRVIVETDDGTLYMAEQLVKFAGGQASCSAPPVGDPAEIAANMGKMDFATVGTAPTGSHQTARARYDLNHPNHTGMVLDPVTLLYIPLLMVERIEARQGDTVVFEMTGSITLAQNPAVEFDFVTNGAAEMTISARDTSGGTWTRSFPIGPAG